MFTGKFDFERDLPEPHWNTHRDDPLEKARREREAAVSKVALLEKALEEARSIAAHNAKIANGLLQCVHYQPGDRTYVIFETELALHPELDEVRKLLPH
jgi:hypothetical protein